MSTTKWLLAVLLAGVTMPALGHHVQKSGTPAPPMSSVAPVSVAGFVSETTIDNRVTGTSSRVLVLHGDDGTRRVLFGAAVAPLRAGAAYVVTGRANGQALFVDSARMTAGTDLRADRLATLSPVSVDGTLRLGHADNFDGGPSEFFYAIVASDAQYRLIGATLVDGLENGMTGTVTGHVADDGELVADRIVITTAGVARAKVTPDASPLTTSYIVLPIKFPTNAVAPFTYGADPFSVASITTAVFGATNSVGHYYAETSFGQQAISGIVADNGSTGWLLAERALPATCDINVIATAAENAATARGYNLASYAGRIYVFSNNVPGCGWAGLAYIGWPRAYIKQTTSLLVIGHEVGHNFGMLHAASLDCGINVVGGTCSSSEYGDPFDIMGNSRAMHPNAAQKFDLGWIAPSTVKMHAAGRATYTLTPIESAGGATYAVKIPAASNRTYWLEYRQPIGYDAGLSSYPNNGAQFRVAAPFESLCSGCADDTEFLDMTPGTTAFTDGTLVLGQSYTDALYGFMVSITSATPTALTVDVAALGSVRKPDFDWSGTTDMLWRSSGGATVSWMMNGTSVTSVAVLMADPNWSITHVGDFDANGKSDILWRNSVTNQTAIWLMNGGAVGSAAIVYAHADWRVTHVADLNGDGKSDLVWRNAATGQTAIWLMNGLTTQSAAIVYADPNWSVTLVGDFNGDGKADFLWSNPSTSQTAIWLMNGATATASAIVYGAANWAATHVADLNGDGKSDIVWRNAATGETALWLMNGMASTQAAIVFASTAWAVTHVGDFDGDGKSDLVWRNPSTGQTAIWMMNGVVPTTTAVVYADSNWTVAQVADLDGNGKEDLIWRDTLNGSAAVWLQNGVNSSARTGIMGAGVWQVLVPN